MRPFVTRPADFIHLATMMKVDVFVSKNRPFERALAQAGGQGP